MKYLPVFYQQVIDGHNQKAMKSTLEDPIVQNRRRQLRRWIDEHFEGSQMAFIASTNDGEKQINQGELSGLLKSKSFGEKRARSLERQAHMPPRHLDSSDAKSVTHYAGEHIEPQPEPAIPIARISPKPWPFTRVSRDRLMNLKRDLGGRRGLDAIDDIDRTLEVVVLKWEKQITIRKSAAN